MAKTIERHGGTVENFVGDEVMGIFGAPVAQGDDALRAVRAAAEMLVEIEALNADIGGRVGMQLGLRIGVNTGTVVVGDPIAGRSMSLGDTMNVAARLEKLAEPGQILIGEDTYQLIRSDVEVEPAGTVELRGRTEPLATFVLRDAVRVDGEPLGDRPLVGRERDLALLQVAFERSVARESCEFVTVLGEPGVGKSRLVAEMLQRYRASARVLAGRCLPYGEGITYWPLIEIVWQAAGIEDADDAEAARAKLEATLAGDPDGRAIARHLAQITGLDDAFDPGGAGVLGGPAAARGAGLTSPSGRLDRGPAVGRADDARADPLPLAAGPVVAHPPRLHRPVRAARQASGPGASRARRRSRSTRSATVRSRDLVDTLTGGGLAPELRSRIVELAAGNPLFVEQVLSMLIDEGVLQRVEDGWAAGNGTHELDVPPTIEALLAARIDHLAAGERALAEAASVIGKDFWANAAAALAGEGGLEEVEALVHKRLIEPVRRAGVPRDFFQFRHILVRDAVYGSLSKARRATLHERFADWLLGWSVADRPDRGDRGLPPGDRPSVPAGAARLPGAGRGACHRAAAHLSNAGRRAAARQDDAAAAGAARARRGAARGEWRLGPVGASGATGGARHRPGAGRETERANQVLAEARRAVVASGDERAEARMRVLEANLKRLTDPVWWTNHGRTAAEQALAVFHRLSDDADAARAWHLLGKVHSDRGQQAAAARRSSGRSSSRAAPATPASRRGSATGCSRSRPSARCRASGSLPELARTSTGPGRTITARSRARRWGGWGRCWPAPARSRRPGGVLRGAGVFVDSTSPSTSPTWRSRRRSSSRSPPIPRRPSASCGPRSTSSWTPGRPTSRRPCSRSWPERWSSRAGSRRRSR